jgi:hypothetical protein
MKNQNTGDQKRKRSYQRTTSHRKSENIEPQKLETNDEKGPKQKDVQEKLKKKGVDVLNEEVCLEFLEGGESLLPECQLLLTLLQLDLHTNSHSLGPRGM